MKLNNTAAMRIMKGRDTIFLSFALALIFLSCNQDKNICVYPRKSFVNIKSIYFQRKDTLLYKKEKILNKIIVLPEVSSGLTDTFLIARGKSTFNMPLNPELKTLKVAYFMDSTYTIPDTLAFYYSNQIIFINQSCGFGFEHTIDSVKSTNLFTDSVLLIKNNTKIGNYEINVEIFFPN